MKIFSWLHPSTLGKKLLMYMGLIILLLVLTVTACTIMICQQINAENMVRLSDIFTQQAMSNMESAINQLDIQYFQAFCASPLPSLLNGIGADERQAGVVYDLNDKNGFTFHNHERFTMPETILWELSEIAFNRGPISSITLWDRNGAVYYFEKMGRKASPDKLDSFQKRLDKISQKKGCSLWSVQEGNLAVERALYYQNSSPIGYLSIEIRSNYFDSMMKSGTIAENCFILFDQMGNIVSLSDQIPDPRMASEIFHQYHTQENVGKSISDIMRFDHTTYLISAYMEKNSNWLLVNIVVYSKVSDIVRPFLFMIAFVSLAAFAIAFVLVYAFSRNLGGRICAIEDQITALTHGDFRRRDLPKGHDEISLISDALNDFGVEMRRTLDHSIRQEHQYYKFRLEMMKMQMSALNAQMNPHFLYNALESISSMALLEASPRASTMLCDFATLLRKNIRNRKGKTTLAEEIEYIRDYLRVMNTVYDHRICDTITLDDAVASFVVPCFFLYPVVENAIVHHNGKSDERIEVEILCADQGDCVVVCVADNGNGIEAHRLRAENESIQSILTSANTGEADVDELSDHIGLENVARTIALFYGSTSQMELREISPHGVAVDMRLPKPFVQDATQVGSQATEESAAAAP